MGIMTVLHGSLSEYVLIFGSPIGTEGFSGRYRIDIYDVMLAGRDVDLYRRQLPRTDRHKARRNGASAPKQVKGFKLPEGGWMLEYGRGPVPTALPFALSGAVTSLDVRTMVKTMWIYGRLVVQGTLSRKDMSTTSQTKSPSPALSIFSAACS